MVVSRGINRTSGPDQSSHQGRQKALPSIRSWCLLRTRAAKADGAPIHPSIHSRFGAFYAPVQLGGALLPVLHVPARHDGPRADCWFDGVGR